MLDFYVYIDFGLLHNCMFRSNLENLKVRMEKKIEKSD